MIALAYDNGKEVPEGDLAVQNRGIKENAAVSR
jgi:hypothetical protein